MSDTSRRGILGLIAACGASLTIPIPNPVRAMSHRRLPPGELRLTRILERGLSGAAKIVVERSWKVRFSHENRGIAIQGEQISAKVDAPPQLQRLAEIEQSRSTDAMFPILLSEAGTIMAAGEMTQADDLAKAVREAEDLIAKRSIPAAAKAELVRLIAQVQEAGGRLLDRMPADLFYPSTEPLRTVQPVKLPDGQAGEFELTYETKCAPDGGWLERAERRVVTRIGGSERRSSEVWTLVPA